MHENMDTFFLGVRAIFTIVNMLSNFFKLDDIRYFLSNINKMIEENHDSILECSKDTLGHTQQSKEILKNIHWSVEYIREKSKTR